MISAGARGNMRKMCLIKKDNNARVMVFIDLRNITKGAAKEISGPFIVDFVSMTEQLVDGRNLKAAYVFDGRGEILSEDTAVALHHKLEFDGFRVITRPSLESEGREQKEVDVAMACRMLRHALNDDFDTAIVVSGDRDFVPAIEMMQEAGKTVEAASFSQCKSRAIERAADICHNLSSMPIMKVIQTPEPADVVPVGAMEGEVAEAV